MIASGPPSSSPACAICASSVGKIISTSAPASRYASERSIALSNDSFRTAPVRAMIRKSGSLRAPTASRTLSTITSSGSRNSTPLWWCAPAWARPGPRSRSPPAGRLDLANRAGQVHRVAKAHAAVHNQRHAGAGRDLPRQRRDLRRSQQRFGDGQLEPEAAPGEVRRVEPQRFDQPPVSGSRQTGANVVCPERMRSANSCRFVMRGC